MAVDNIYQGGTKGPNKLPIVPANKQIKEKQSESAISTLKNLTVRAFSSRTRFTVEIEFESML